MHKFTVVFALLGILNPYTSFAQSPSLSPNKTIDIRLDDDGRMTGQVVNGAGQPLPAAKLRMDRLAPRPSESFEVEVGENGIFKTAALSAGTYRLHTANGVICCRCWSSKAAPPQAASGLLVVDDAQVARGQRPIGELFRTEPLLIAAVITAAVAIPIAVHKSRDDAPEGS